MGIPNSKLDFTPYEPCFLHGDPVAGNFIKSDRVVAIDWQCPAIGDPCDDIAIYLSAGMQSIYRGAPLTDEEKATFWEAYDNQTVKERFTKMEPTYKACFAKYFTQRGTPEDLHAAKLEMQTS